MIICDTVHSASVVTDWNTNPGCFASDFGTARLELFSQVWDDSCDYGFVLENPHTGNRTVWYVDEEILDHDNEELAGWKLKPVDESVRKFPKLKNTVLTIWND